MSEWIAVRHGRPVNDDWVAILRGADLTLEFAHYHASGWWSTGTPTRIDDVAYWTPLPAIKKPISKDDALRLAIDTISPTLTTGDPWQTYNAAFNVLPKLREALNQ